MLKVFPAEQHHASYGSGRVLSHDERKGKKIYIFYMFSFSTVFCIFRLMSYVHVRYMIMKPLYDSTSVPYERCMMYDTIRTVQPLPYV